MTMHVEFNLHVRHLSVAMLISEKISCLGTMRGELVGRELLQRLLKAFNLKFVSME